MSLSSFSLKLSDLLVRNSLKTLSVGKIIPKTTLNYKVFGKFFPKLFALLMHLCVILLNLH